MTALKKGISGLLVFLSCVSLSQTLSFSRYTTSDGLLSDEVYNLHQDKEGYLWLFTNYGALKYNSLEFKPVLRNLPFNESFIYCIYENKKGRKWVANSKGKIYEVIHDSAFVVKGTERVSAKLHDASDEIGQLYVDDSLNIYALTKHYSYKFIKSRNYSAVNLSKQLNTDSVIYKVLKKENTLIPLYNFQEEDINHWFTRKNPVGVLLPSNEPGGYSFHELNLTKKGGTKFFKQFGDDIYFSIYDKLGKYSGKTKKIYYRPLNSFINNYIKDKKGHTWVACVNGLYELDEHDSLIHHYLENVTINDLLIDSQNGFWASSSGQGLFHYENIDNLYFKENDLLSNPLRFMKKLDDRLFIATVTGDLFMVRNARISHILQEKDPGNSLHTIVKYKSNYLVSGIFGTKEIHVDDNGKSKILASHKIYNALNILPVNNDSMIFLSRKGLGTIVNMAIKTRIDSDFQTYDWANREKDYLLATDKGIYARSKVLNTAVLKAFGDYLVYYDSLIQPDYLSSSKNAVIKKIARDSLGRWWFGSIGSGLFILDTANHLRHLTVAEGLPSNIINDISFSPDGNAVLCTNKGLFISPVNSTGTQSYVWNKIYPGEVENARVFENRIYLGTKNGLVILNYEEVREKEGISFNLNAVYLNSTEVNASKLNEIPYNQNNLEFKFDVICFSHDRPELKYYLSGAVADSGTVGGATIKLLHLAPGTYSLTAFPDIHKGDALKIVIPFTIVPAWWQTTAFFVLLVLFIILAVSLTLWLILRSARKKREQKETAERLILEYKLIALKAQINPHFMSNCLSAIQLLIIHNKVDAATHYIARFGLLVRQILNFSTRSLVSLREELEITSLNVELEQLRFENKFRFEVRIDAHLDPKKIFVPALILNPIIENAIWHGLLPLKGSRPGKLLIEVKQIADALTLIIEDNGVGRNSDKQKIGNTRQSKGIQLTEQRLSNINYLYNITTAQFIFSYLADEDESRNGARVTISLPFNLTPLQNE